MGPSEYGSDAIVRGLAELGITHLGLNPGATTRGLHDSLIRQEGVAPILALDERVAVAMAHGYAKRTGRPMAVALHNLVGLLSGSIGVFNSFIDRVPMLVLSGVGPADKLRRRPWIDWIHSVRSQGNSVRDFVKWSDEPRSLTDTLDSLVRGYEIAMTPPMGPVHIGIDTEIQEEVLDRAAPSLPRAPVPIRLGGPRRAHLEAVAQRLDASTAPVIVTDYLGRTRAGFDALVALADTAGARVIDLGSSHNFPTSHPANATSTKQETIAAADLVLAIDVRNTSFAVRTSDARTRESTLLLADGAEVVEVGEGPLLDRPFIDLGQRHPVDETVVADPVEFTQALAERAQGSPRAAERLASLRAVAASGEAAAAPAGQADDRAPLSGTDILSVTHAAVRDVPWVVAHSGIRAGFGRHWPMDTHGSHLGRSGGSGLGYSVGGCLGVALASEPGTVVVDLQGDGDMYYTASGLWTAARYRLPVLFVVLNNRTYGQDRMHQREIAHTRGRPMPDEYPGIDIGGPEVDVPGLARSFGLEAHGPATTRAELAEILGKAVATVAGGRPALVDVAYDG